MTLTHKTEELADLIEKRKILILGMTNKREENWNRKLQLNYKQYWPGNDPEPRSGVGFILHKYMDACSQVTLITGRKIPVPINLNRDKYSVLHIYAQSSGMLI